MIENWTEMQPTLFNAENIQFQKFFFIIHQLIYFQSASTPFIYSDLSSKCWLIQGFEMRMFRAANDFILNRFLAGYAHKNHKKDYLDLFNILYFDLSSQEWGLKAIKLEGNSLIACTSDKSARASWLMASWLFPGPWEVEKPIMRIMSVPSLVSIHYCLMINPLEFRIV